MTKSSVVDNETGKSMDSTVRTSTGTFFGRGQDAVLAAVEKRIAQVSTHWHRQHGAAASIDTHVLCDSKHATCIQDGLHTHQTLVCSTHQISLLLKASCAHMPYADLVIAFIGVLLFSGTGFSNFVMHRRLCIGHMHNPIVLPGCVAHLPCQGSM